VVGGGRLVTPTNMLTPGTEIHFIRMSKEILVERQCIYFIERYTMSNINSC
jgi:hypothetical protein